VHQLTSQPAVAVEVDLQAKRCPGRHAQVAQAELLIESGKGQALRPAPPLRTRRASFPAPGSTLGKAP
jgi:hypothetical protein